MEKTKIIIAGAQFSDPKDFVLGVSFFFQSQTVYKSLNEVDMSITTEFNYSDSCIEITGLIPSLFHRESVYKNVLENASNIIYLFPYSKNSMNIGLMDFSYFKSKIRGNCKIDYYLNDNWQGRYVADTITCQELQLATNQSWNTSSISNVTTISEHQIAAVLNEFIKK